MDRGKKRQEPRGAPQDVYQKGERGWPVPGIGAPYEEPLEPEIVVDTSSTPLKDAVATVNDFLIRNMP
jgi:adenylylsulfate kinase-like enzyme